MRYRLLDPTRAYALEILTDDTERAELAARHAVYYRRWLARTADEWATLTTGAERAPHFAALNNVRAALEWCFSPEGNIAIGVGLAAAAAPVFLAMSSYKAVGSSLKGQMLIQQGKIETGMELLRGSLARIPLILISHSGRSRSPIPVILIMLFTMPEEGTADSMTWRWTATTDG